MNNRIRIAVDGPAAAGKSTIAKIIAKKLSIVYVDTGAMYRALTLKAIQREIDLADEDKLAALLAKTDIILAQQEEAQLVYLDGLNVTDHIRNNEVTNHVSHVAQHAKVRQEMVVRQQKLANNVSVVMDGRDIGTRVLPNAEVKFFLKASVEERALRRFKENKTKGFSSDLTILEEEIRERDERDTNRKSSPLIEAEDATIIDTTALSIENVVDEILQHVQAYQRNSGKFSN